MWPKIAKNSPYWHHRITLSGYIFAVRKNLPRDVKKSVDGKNKKIKNNATKPKRLRSKILSHIINVHSVSDDVSWQDKIGLHQFDFIKCNNVTM